jgi:hypothetical protein
VPEPPRNLPRTIAEACWVVAMKQTFYRERAADCQDRADHAPTESLRADWQALAEVWSSMADRMDSLKSSRLPKHPQRNTAH